MSSFLRSIFGPRLFYIYKTEKSPGKEYVQNIVENCGDTVIKWMRFCWSVSYWTSPVILIFLYRRGTLTPEGLLGLSTYASSLGILLCAAVIVRAVGRSTNPEYTRFISLLYKAKKDFTTENKRLLCGFDSEFSAWPVDYRWSDASGKDDHKPVTSAGSKSSPSNRQRATGGQGITTLPCQILSYVAAHTFGRRMVYPGATSLIQTLMSTVLTQGRCKLVEEKQGVRAKLQAEDGNHIDTMFIDRRNDSRYPNGNILVVCCEGNAGFYEIGCTTTPLEAGYSVLGWNHPGFWGSTGQPFPSQEKKAVDVVMQYAIHKLGFQPYDTVLFAWSIGGFTATYAAMCYPDIRYLILDATFDDIVPLAVARMPQSWRTLVIMTVKKYLNLNNVEQLCKYDGPVLLIRRAKDEMISTIDPSVIASNRGNDLLIKFLQHRYPQVVTETTLPILREWCAADKTNQVVLWSGYDVNEDLCTSTVNSFIMENPTGYPSNLGEGLDQDTRIQLTLFLANKYMADFDSTHCTPLPVSHFKSPWIPGI